MTNKITKILFPVLTILIAAVMMAGCTDAGNTNDKTAEVKPPAVESKTTESKTTESTTTENKAAEPVQETKKEAGDAAIDAKFIINKTASDENPTSTIDISCNGKTTRIAKISGEAALTDKSEYKEKGIPANAVSACGAWWAGAGDYFYFIVSGNKVLVYQGWQDEGQDDRGYHWKKVKEIM